MAVVTGLRDSQLICLKEKLPLLAVTVYYRERIKLKPAKGQGGWGRAGRGPYGASSQLLPVESRVAHGSASNDVGSRVV